MTSERDALRHALRARRRAIAAPERLQAAEQLADRLLDLPFVPQSGCVAGYWALDGEIALHVWQLRLPSPLVYCLPVLQADRLCFAPWRPGEPLVANRFGIPEPDIAASSLLDAEAMTLVVLPLVGFDAQGGRLGMGGGWYDRSFAFRRHNRTAPWLVGAAFAAQQLDSLGAESWDVPLDAVCTERDTFLPAASYESTSP